MNTTEITHRLDELVREGHLIQKYGDYDAGNNIILRVAGDAVRVESDDFMINLRGEQLREISTIHHKMIFEEENHKIMITIVGQKRPRSE